MLRFCVIEDRLSGDKSYEASNAYYSFSICYVSK